MIRWRLRAVTARAMLLVVLGAAILGTLADPAWAATGMPQDGTYIYLPLVIKPADPPPSGLCRYGVGAGSHIVNYDVGDLRLGWYVDWTAQQSPVRPGRIAYMPTIRLRAAVSGGYTYTPSGATLATAIGNNPGALWLIGNEPDRRVWQDSLEPQVYARAYHDLYYLIKGLDPSAQIAAGSIVQPSPLRLQYLDLVLDSYRRAYHESMPVDVWNIHAFILNERSCTHYPGDCWGAEIPPGIDAAQGMVLTIDDNDNLEIFRQLVVDFRQWMADRGYQHRPLIISEFGVQMPPDFGFPPERVNAYLSGTFQFLATATGPTGYPADGNRLVQRWAWFSLTDVNYNGWLFDPVSKQRTVVGDRYAALTAAVPPTADLKVSRAWVANASTPVPGTGVTMTLRAEIANGGEHSTQSNVLVRFYDGNPVAGGKQIGGDQHIFGLGGCLASANVSVMWPRVPPGLHTVYVLVDPDNVIAESNETNNATIFEAMVGGSRGLLPLVLKPSPH